MRVLALIVLVFVSLGMAKVPPTTPEPKKCDGKDWGKLLAQGFNEHYVHQMRNGSLDYFVQDRDYYECMCNTVKSQDMTKEDWESTVDTQDYKEVK